MTIFRVKQRFIRMQQRVRSEKTARKLVPIAGVAIIVVFLLSVYAFIVDLNMGISKEQEMLIAASHNASPVLEEEEAADGRGEESDPLFAVPQGAATPVPVPIKQL